MRDTVSVIQHAYSALLYIQETTSCSGCCMVHGEEEIEKPLEGGNYALYAEADA